MIRKKEKQTGCFICMSLMLGGILAMALSGILYVRMVWNEGAGELVKKDELKQGTKVILTESGIDPTLECVVRLGLEIKSSWVTQTAIARENTDSPQPVNDINARIPYEIVIRDAAGNELETFKASIDYLPTPYEDAKPVKLENEQTQERTHVEYFRFNPPPDGDVFLSILVQDDEQYQSVASGHYALFHKVPQDTPELAGGFIFLFLMGPVLIVVGASVAVVMLFKNRGHS